MSIILFRSLQTWSKTLLALLFLTGIFAYGEQSSTIPVMELVRKTVQNELNANNSNAQYMFRDYKETGHGSETKLMVETRDAMAGLLIAINGKPLNAEQRQAEDARVNRFLNNSDELQKRQRQEKEDNRRVERIMRALPDAFLYQYDGTASGCAGMGKSGHLLTRLRFRPNPNYDPPTRVEQVLTGMAGTILIDTNEYRIAKIDGRLQDEVSFGWGILGHLDPGGHFLVEQGDVGDNHWEISRMDLSFTGKILFFKSINITQQETMSNFKRVPSDLTFAQGLDLLRKQEALLADNESNR